MVLQVKDIICCSAPTDIWQDAGQVNACPDVLPACVPSHVQMVAIQA